MQWSLWGGQSARGSTWGVTEGGGHGQNEAGERRTIRRPAFKSRGARDVRVDKNPSPMLEKLFKATAREETMPLRQPLGGWVDRVVVHTNNRGGRERRGSSTCPDSPAREKKHSPTILQNREATDKG